MKIPSRHHVVDFAVLVLRWYLAYYMFTYGWSKITAGQFHVKPNVLAQPLKDVNHFYIAWYLFSLSKTFNIVVGLTQILGAMIIVFNRLAVIGALVLLPVLVNILLIDVAFTMQMFGFALVIRLICMVLADLFILYYYRELLIVAFHQITDGLSTRLRYRWWIYLLLPVLGFLADFVIATLTLPIKWLLLNFSR